MCGPCIRHFIAWWKGHSKKRWGKHDFYAHAAGNKIEFEVNCCPKKG